MLLLAGACALVLALAASPAEADFPFGSGPPFKLAPGSVPSDLAGDGNDWKFAATAETNSPYASDPRELFGVRGAHVVDSDPSVDTAWQISTGRPDVTIAVLDSGIKWNDAGAMTDLRRKARLNKGELPKPKHGDSSDCAAYDCNGDGVFNVDDYASDPRVSLSDPRRVGPAGVLVPQDLIIAFSNGSDADHNGFVDDIAGWDFLDNDNDPFDDVQYGHGTGEAKDSSAEANNGGQAGACPNCMFVPLRVGDSFVADADRFAQGVIYAVDNGIFVVQEALGALNNTRLAREAVEYAYRHGVPIIASAADEAAQHHNWPSNYPHTIVVNSVNKYASFFTPNNQSYLQFNGCTNFSTKITLSIPSSSCSSNATGLAAGYAGLIYSAALNARDAGSLDPHPSCRRANGTSCILSATEVRELMASGEINGSPRSDDVNFATQPEPSCSSLQPGCTDPNLLFADVEQNRPIDSQLVESKSYPARKGFDEFYGYGRANIAKATEATDTGAIPPEAEITSPEWFAQIDPAKRSVDIDARVFARSAPYRCRVEAAPGSEPNNGRTTDTPPGDFARISSAWCDGSSHTNAFDSAADGPLATIDLTRLAARFPPQAFDGRQPPPGPPNFNGRPNDEPYGFTVRVVVTSVQGGKALTGQDRRNLYLHHDHDLLPGFPKSLPSDGEPSPTFADLDGDNRNELVFATDDGIVHAQRPDGSELAGWPVHGDPLPLHTGGRAFRSGEVSDQASFGAMPTAAVGDLDRDGSPEVVAADSDGKVYVWYASGQLRFKRQANQDFSGRPLQPFENVRKGSRYRTQHGFLASPVLADLDGDGGDLEIVVAGMDRHVYAWHAHGARVAGFPVLVVDRSKISAIDPITHAPTFKSGIGSELDQGAIIDTPAVGDIDGDGRPEIVVGTNEEYSANDDGGLNAGNLSSSLGLLLASGDPGNSRLYAIKSTGDPGGPTVSGPSPFVPNWPVKVAMLNTEVLPVVGEGITGAPVIGPVTCPSGGGGAKAGVTSALGPAYLFNSDGTSCYGSSSGHDNVMEQDFAASTARFDTPAIPAFGNPAFGRLTGGGVSFLAPVSGLIRFFDTALNEYQGGQDFIAAWNAASGNLRSGFPSPVNDLQFLTGPSAADIGGGSAEEVIGGTSSLDLNALDAGTGAPFSQAWPKLTSDWMTANPLIGTFGTFDTDAGARKVVVALTRSGTLFAYGTDAAACSPGSWPRFHHDNANSGDLRRDAALPGKPYGFSLSGRNLTFHAPGDDLLCGAAAKYEIAQSNDPITAANFENAESLGSGPVPTAAGTTQTIKLPAQFDRFVAIRAIDDQGNVGPLGVVDLGG
jgi:hypothetical protein